MSLQPVEAREQVFGMNLQPIGAREQVFGTVLHPEFVGMETVRPRAPERAKIHEYWCRDYMLILHPVVRAGR